MKLLKKTAKVFLKATPSEVHQWRTEQRYNYNYALYVVLVLFLSSDDMFCFTRYPEYILDHIDSFSLAAKSERAVKAAIVTYCFFLMTLHTTHPRHVVKGSESMPAAPRHHSTVPPPSFHLSVSFSVCLSVCLSICLSVCLSVCLDVSFLDVAPPTEVQQQLMSRYVEGGGSSGGTRSFSPRMRDKVLLHLFVLTLFLDDFSISCHSLQRDLKLTSNK